MTDENVMVTFSASLRCESVDQLQLEVNIICFRSCTSPYGMWVNLAGKHMVLFTKKTWLGLS